jgi:hypothetical protein
MQISIPDLLENRLPLFRPVYPKEVSVDHIYGRLTDAHFADKLLRMNYDIHVGALAGFPEKSSFFW